MVQIVILDDRETNRRIFSKLAASIEPDVEVESFGNPADLLAWLQTNIPDLIVTDFKMPTMDGAEFISRFRALPHCGEIPVIVITVYEEREFRLRALEAGATDFLNSPVDHQEFVTRARNLLKLRKQQLQLAARADNLAQELEDSERSHEKALRDSSERLAQVIDTLPALISATDTEGRVLFINAYLASLAGIGPNEAAGWDLRPIFGEDHAARSEALDRKVLDTQAPLPSFEEEIIDHTGAKRVFLTTKTPLRDGSNAVVGVLTSSLDITDRKRAENHLFYMAHHDVLTNLANRALLSDRLRREIARTRRGDSPFALHLIDLDGFKDINDGLGHQVGDQFLVEVGNRLRSVVRDTDTVARLGGDEFAVLQTRVTRNEDAVDMANRILDAINTPWSYAGEHVALSASIGIAVHPADGSDVQELLRNSDLAMYRAKHDGGKMLRFYASDMDRRARASLILDSDLRTAIEKEQFVLHYQPQIALRSGRVTGAEALLRWQRPGHGLIGPSEFLARAEENGLIVPINEWALREACRQAKLWQQRGHLPIRVGVNLSSIQFFKQNVPLMVTKVLAETGLDPWLLDLELTESIVMHNAEAVSKDLQQLRELGVGISIDDFGTRYSTLAYVKHFPVDRLKIDQCFVREIATNPSDAAIVRAIVSLGHSLDLKIVAEGVETLQQTTLLRGEGCDEVQGFYFGGPMVADELLAFVRENRARARSA
ncbi:MAG TPA: EAL domain-containing protein [Pseudolabrys sp.]|nr:EAL domain-containing protein [Pseudolabrys sp.]